MKDWEKSCVFQGKTGDFILSGPTYPNADLHLGNIYNLVLKDALVRMHAWKNGVKPLFLHGIDAHGLPLLRAVEKKFPHATEQEKYDLCVQLLQKNSQNISQTLRRWAICAHQDFYCTHDQSYVQKELECLKKLVSQGYIEIHTKPVYFCSSCATALSETEVYNKDIRTTGFWVLFPWQDTNLLVYTTSLFSLFDNQAVAFDPREKYFVHDFAGRKFVCKHTRHFNPLREVQLRGSEAVSPLSKKNVPLLESNLHSVGTGLVHLASDHSFFDYDFLKQHGISPMGTWKGKMLMRNGRLVDKKTSQLLALRTLALENHLLFSKVLQSKKPFCCRCKNSVEIQATPQVFFNLQHNNLQQRTLELLSKANASESLLSALRSRKEWCISRQRSWGLHIPTQLCVHCNRVFLTQEKLIDATAQTSCKQCHAPLVDHPYTLDVWFDSGIAAIASGRKYTAILEGYDQNRGWFQSLSLLSVAVTGEIPFEQVVDHGFVVNRGEKVSKSSGQYVTAMQFSQMHPVDPARLYLLTRTRGRDITFDPNDTREYVKAHFHLSFLNKKCSENASGERDTQLENLVAQSIQRGVDDALSNLQPCLLWRNLLDVRRAVNRAAQTKKIGVHTWKTINKWTRTAYGFFLPFSCQ